MSPAADAAGAPFLSYLILVICPSPASLSSPPPPPPSPFPFCWSQCFAYLCICSADVLGGIIPPPPERPNNDTRGHVDSNGNNIPTSQVITVRYDPEYEKNMSYVVTPKVWRGAVLRLKWPTPAAQPRCVGSGHCAPRHRLRHCDRHAAGGHAAWRGVALGGAADGTGGERLFPPEFAPAAAADPLLRRSQFMAYGALTGEVYVSDLTLAYLEDSGHVRPTPATRCSPASFTNPSLLHLALSLRSTLPITP